MNRGRIILHSTLPFIFSSTFDMKGTWTHQSYPTAAFASNRLTVSVKSVTKRQSKPLIAFQKEPSYYLLIQNSTCLILHDFILEPKLRTVCMTKINLSKPCKPFMQGCKELSSKELSSRSSPVILELELN